MARHIPITALFLIFISACSDNPNVTVNPPSGGGGGIGGGGGATVATVAITPATPAPILIGATLQFTATAYDATVTPISGATFSWSSSVPAVASITAIGTTVTATGLTAGTTTISAISGGVTSNLVTLTVTCAGIPSAVSTPTATPTAVSTFGQSALSVTVTDCLGGNVPDGTQVTFALSPTAIGVVTGGATNPATTTAGIATSTFTANNIAGNASITARAGTVTSNPVSIPVNPPASGSIQFVSATPPVIGIKGAGTVEASTIRFMVSDVNGNPVADGTQVNFDMIGPNCTSVQGTSTCPNPSTDANDEYISPDVGSTVNGIATTILHSGKVAGPVLVKATVALNTTLSTAATGVSIGGGVASASHFHVSSNQINLAGHTGIGGYDDQSATLTAFLADRFGNKNVLAGTSISFYTEAGHLFSSIVTGGGESAEAAVDESGKASVVITSQGTIPINTHPWVNFTAVSGTTRNDLFWDPTAIFWRTYSPATAVAYDIFRNTAFQRIPIEAYDPTAGNPLGGTSWNRIATVTSPTATYADTGLTNNTAYYYFAIARDAAGRVAETPVISATPRAVGSLTSGVTISEPSYADRYELPNPITTAIRNPRDGWVTVLAVTQGEEGFFDQNGNGIYDAGEKFIDTPGEPFLDADDNGVYNRPESFLDLNLDGIYNLGEPFIDDNNNGRYDSGDPFFIDVNHDTLWNGPNGAWDSSTLIWKQIKLLFSGALYWDRLDNDVPSQPQCVGVIAPYNCEGQTASRIEITRNQDPNNPDRFRVPNGGCADFEIYLSDRNLNWLIPGTVVSVAASVGKLVGTTGASIPDLSWDSNTLAPVGPYIVNSGVCDSDPNVIKTEDGTINVKVSWSPQNHDGVEFILGVAGTMDYIPLTISTAFLLPGTVGVAYSQTLTAVSGTPAYNWTLFSGSLPPGLALAGGTGIISGTPTTVGTYSFTVQVQDTITDTDTQVLSITVN